MGKLYFPPYHYQEYDLKRIRSDEPIGLAGSDLIVVKNPIPLDIRLDDIRNDKITIQACDMSAPITITGIPFKEVWMTNDYADGKIIFLVLYGGSGVEIIEELQKPKGIDRLFASLGILKNIPPKARWEL